MSSKVLSTKILSSPQRSLVLNAGLRLVEYNAINITYLNFELPKTPFDAYIFTSQNGVQSFTKQYAKSLSSTKKPSNSKPVYCVGEKTKQLLEKNCFHVMEVADSAKELGERIVANPKKTSFLWIAGNRRRNELSELLNHHQITFNILIGYNTSLNPKSFKQYFDGVLFFSPSGVSSFFQKNEMTGTAFCIGQTTVEAVQKHTNSYHVANRATVENVIVQAVKHLQKND